MSDIPIIVGDSERELSFLNLDSLSTRDMNPTIKKELNNLSHYQIQQIIHDYRVFGHSSLWDIARRYRIHFATACYIVKS